MANKKLTLLLGANFTVLLLVRLILVAAAAANSTETASSQQEANSTSNVATSIFDTINSLDYSPSGQKDAAAQRSANDVQRLKFEEAAAAKGKRRSKNLKGRQEVETVARLLLKLLGKLETVDFKQLLLGGGGATAQKRSDSAKLTQGGDRTATSGRLNASSSFAGETGNLLSITKQLVKLARGHMLNDFGPHYSSYQPFYQSMPSNLAAAASNMFHDTFDSLSGSSSGHLSAKSDWLWLVTPAAIVLGAGVILVPLVAAYLVSNMVQQNTFTVSAGRRRRKRQASELRPETSDEQLLGHLLDWHKLFDGTNPELLVEQLARFHSALNNVDASFIKSTLSGPAKRVSRKNVKKDEGR